MKENLPKIKQNLDVKQKAITNTRQLKEYIYNKRANLTYEEIDVLINNLANDLMEFAYGSGWDDRNEIYRVLKSRRHTKLIKAFNVFYNENISNIPVHVMEKVRYLSDIALLNRPYNENLPFSHQVDDIKI